jgi:hypothetical protein
MLGCIREMYKFDVACLAEDTKAKAAETSMLSLKILPGVVQISTRPARHGAKEGAEPDSFMGDE